MVVDEAAPVRLETPELLAAADALPALYGQLASRASSTHDAVTTTMLVEVGVIAAALDASEAAAAVSVA